MKQYQGDPDDGDDVIDAPCLQEGEESVTVKQRKLLAEQKLQADRELQAERERRRQERKARPKSRFKGVSWDTRSSRWHTQLWNGTTVSQMKI